MSLVDKFRAEIIGERLSGVDMTKRRIVMDESMWGQFCLELGISPASINYTLAGTEITWRPSQVPYWQWEDIPQDPCYNIQGALKQIYLANIKEMLEESSTFLKYAEKSHTYDRTRASRSTSRGRSFTVRTHKR